MRVARQAAANRRCAFGTAPMVVARPPWRSVASQRSSHVSRAKTESVDLPIGELAPAFEVRGKKKSSGTNRQHCSGGCWTPRQCAMAPLTQHLCALSQLPDVVSGKTVKLADFKGSPGGRLRVSVVVVVFAARMCVLVVHIRGETPSCRCYPSVRACVRHASRRGLHAWHVGRDMIAILGSPCTSDQRLSGVAVTGAPHHPHAA